MSTKTLSNKLRNGTTFDEYNVRDITQDKTEYIIDEELQKQFWNKYNIKE